MIQRDGLASEYPGSAAWQGSDERAQANGARAEGYGSQGNPRINHWVSARRQRRLRHLVPQEEAVPAGFLCFMSQVGQDACITIRPKMRDIDSVTHCSRILTRGAARPLPDRPFQQTVYETRTGKVKEPGNMPLLFDDPVLDLHQQNPRDRLLNAR